MAKRKKTIFVLDTSVLLYDHQSLMSFQEHDVAIPIAVLEEVDTFKKGNDTLNFEAREFIRLLDKISINQNLQEWIPIGGPDKGQLKVQMRQTATIDAEDLFNERKADHRILNAALALMEEFPTRKVVLVSKDNNLRLKARSLNVPAEDYLTGKVNNVDNLFQGRSLLNKVQPEIIDLLYKNGWCDWQAILPEKPMANHYFICRNGSENSVLCYYNAKTDRIEIVHKTSSYGIRPRNAEQTFAMHAVLNPDVKLVTIQGVAGTGKTLIALAGALEQRSDFRQIFLARPIVPLSNRDIGYLPGDIKSKINPYMEPLWDNLKLIQNQFQEKDKEYQKITEMVESEKLHITPLAYIRGRSLSNIIFIIDEAQNLTPHEVKTIITRAGENTKIIFTGDIFQIDTPYLDAQSNGLSYLIDRVKGNSLYTHVTLEKGERSELANLAGSLL